MLVSPLGAGTPLSLAVPDRAKRAPWGSENDLTGGQMLVSWDLHAMFMNSVALGKLLAA